MAPHHLRLVCAEPVLHTHRHAFLIGLSQYLLLLAACFVDLSGVAGFL